MFLSAITTRVLLLLQYSYMVFPMRHNLRMQESST